MSSSMTSKESATEATDNILLNILHSFEHDEAEIAVVDDNKRYTFGQLNRRSNAICSELQEQNVKTGSLVPVISSGGIDMIAAMIGVLRCGAAFVPIDSRAPDSRIREMVNALDPLVSVVDSSITELSTDLGPVLSTQISELDRPDRAHISSGSDLAYGYFTSGSTGTPKCCLNIHSGIANRFSVMSDTFRLERGEAVLQNSYHTFDSSLWQILWPLSVGATVVVPRREGILDIANTIGMIGDHKVIMTDFVPSILDVFLSFLEKKPGAVSQLDSMRHILVGGEEVSARIVNRCMHLLPWVQVTNTYGPTEASIGMVFHHFRGHQEDPVPLGTPIRNTHAKVVDDALIPVEDGTIGQIVIGGKCMGVGYLNDQQKTDNAFVQAPHLDFGSEKVFLTGDLGRVENGLLFFHGRVDHQVKIRGVRIELNEIEAKLEELDGLAQARVVTVNGRDGHPILVS